MAFYDSIQLEKGMYRNGSTLTEVLEKLDPSENYKGSELEGLDAYQRQLKRFDIKTGGAYSDKVQKFFENSSSAALFPEYVARAVKQGMENADCLKNIVAAKTIIDGVDYRSVESESMKGSSAVGEGAELPKTNLRTGKNLVKMVKRGRMLVASYEAVKYQRIDLFTVTLRQIGAYIAREQLRDAVEVLINGDGSGNAASVINVAEAGKLSYNDMVKLWAELTPYQLNAVLAPTDAMQSILCMNEMKDARAGLDFQGSGKMVTPLGANLIHNPSMVSGQIVGFDKNCTLEMVQSGNVLLDTDKLIDRQLEKASISCIAGFAKLFADSAKVLKIS